MRAFLERWSMRLKESRTVLTVGMWGGILLLNIVRTVRPYLSAFQTAGIVLVTVAGGIGFSYFYPEYVMKGEEKERRFRKDNFVDPKTYIYQQIDTAQMAVQAKAISQDWDMKRTEEELRKVTHREIERFFDGIPENEIKDNFNGGIENA